MTFSVGDYRPVLVDELDANKFDKFQCFIFSFLRVLYSQFYLAPEVISTESRNYHCVR